MSSLSGKRVVVSAHDLRELNQRVAFARLLIAKGVKERDALELVNHSLPSLGASKETVDADVFVAMYGEPSEGGFLVGVYRTQGQAERAIEAKLRRKGNGPNMGYYWREVKKVRVR